MKKITMKKITIKKQYEILRKTILKYGSAQVVIGNHMTNTPSRKRIIKKDGTCKVSYWHGCKSGFTRKYYISCFSMYTEKDIFSVNNRKKKRLYKRNLKLTMEQMKSHDRGCFYIKEIKVKPEGSTVYSKVIL